MSGRAELDRGRLPVLTEVVELPPDAAAAPRPEPAAAPAVEPAPVLESWVLPPSAAAGAIDAEALVGQVLAALQPRLDAWFEARVRDALAPALERVLAGAAAEARGALAASLRALVADAVAQALAERAPR
ncbi:MAG: hypothetical protein MUE62_08000 [Burkholderiaceae bacterium]|nr:hypothetical protein [Burkholderiaceae bacterium]